MIKIEHKIWPLVPCAGVGARSGGGAPKQYMMLADKTVIEHTLLALQAVPVLEKIVVVLAPNDELFLSTVKGFDGCVAHVGGHTRAQSVRAGLQALREQGAQDDDWVLVHDAARCLVQASWVEELITTCVDDKVGGILAQPVPDTLKRAVGGRSCETVSRENMWLAQTPQMFRIKLLELALDEAAKRRLEITDEASSIEAMGLKPLLVPCSAENFKLTYPEDFARAELILLSRRV